MYPKFKDKIKCLVWLLVLFVIPVYSFGVSLQLNRIGSLDLDGNMYSEWWYTGSKPTFYGTAEVSSTVTVKVDGTEATTSADGSGNWTYYLDKDAGDYAIEIVQGAENVSFTLYLGQSLPDGSVESTESTSSVPATGFDQYIALMLGVGVILLATYFYISGDSNKKAVFETRILKED